MAELRFEPKSLTSSPSSSDLVCSLLLPQNCANNCRAKELVEIDLKLLANKKVLLKTLNEFFCFSDTVVDGTITSSEIL